MYNCRSVVADGSGIGFESFGMIFKSFLLWWCNFFMDYNLVILERVKEYYVIVVWRIYSDEIIINIWVTCFSNLIKCSNVCVCAGAQARLQSLCMARITSTVRFIFFFQPVCYYKNFISSMTCRKRVQITKEEWVSPIQRGVFLFFFKVLSRVALVQVSYLKPLQFFLHVNWNSSQDLEISSTSHSQNYTVCLWGLCEEKVKVVRRCLRGNSVRSRK